jgi:hypothetical protein
MRESEGVEGEAVMVRLSRFEGRCDASWITAVPGGTAMSVTFRRSLACNLWFLRIMLGCSRARLFVSL